MLDSIKDKLIKNRQQLIEEPQDSSIINNILLKSDYQTLNLIQEKNEIDINEKYVSEWVKCRQNPLYYILNYVYFQEIGGKQKYNKYLLHKKLRRVVRCAYKYHMCMLMASRQLGKSTISAALLSWASIFYPSNRIVIFNFRKDSAQENLKKIKFVNKNLPRWMAVPNSSRSDIKTYLELQNGSRIDTFYPSTTSSPDTLARSLSVPINYKVAF
ncbi:MAG: hypothetical protein WC188_03005 [Candidatus Caldatribacteriota bacterium]|nr:hypothetical protein [Patescibacteria group bacterium]